MAAKRKSKKPNKAVVKRPKTGRPKGTPRSAAKEGGKRKTVKKIRRGGAAAKRKGRGGPPVGKGGG